MTNEFIILKNEKVLLEYLYKMLSLGYTDGIREEEYFNFINQLEKTINSDNSMLAKKIKIQNESFSDIVEKAMIILEKSCKRPKQPLLYKEIDGSGMIIPTYDLGKLDSSDYKIFAYPRQIALAKDLYEKLIPKIELSTYEWSNFDNLDGAKKVASLYIEKLADRYVRERINACVWPLDGADIDRYIFEQDFASLIGEVGTKETFTKAYLHAVKIISQMKDEASKRETIIFSNNPNKPLAYANYLKIVLPEEINFLLKYSYKDYALNDAEVEVKTNGSYAKYKSVTCVSSDPSGEWSDVYEREEENISEEHVKIMEKRIGNRIY